MKVFGRIHLFAIVPAFVVGLILAHRAAFELTPAPVIQDQTATARSALRPEDGPLREFIDNLKVSSGGELVPVPDSCRILNSQELDALRIRYPDDKFFALEDVLHTSQAEPVRFFAWMQRGQHWPPLRADSGGLFEGLFEAWRLKDEAGMASTLLEHPDGILRAIGLRRLLVTKDRALLKRVLEGLFEVDYNSSEFFSIDPAVSLSLSEFLALAREFPASPGRDRFVRRQIKSLLESFSEPADPFDVGNTAKPDARLIETWRDLSDDLRAFAVEFGFFGWENCAKAEFPGLLEMAKPVLLKATGDQQTEFDHKFWKSIGGAWARESFPEALQWMQSSFPPGRQFKVERKVFREAFETHPEAVLAAIEKLPSSLRQQECLHELRVSCPPPLRPRLEEFTAQVLPESRRSLMQRMSR